MRLQGISNLYNRMWMFSDVGTLYQLWKFRELQKQYYDELWRRSAWNIGAEFIEWKYGFHQIRRDGMTTVVTLSRVMLDDHLTLNIMGHKALTYDLLRTKGCRVPEHCAYSMSEIRKAEGFLAEHGGGVVVKPASGTGGGRGVTTGITTVSQLRSASKYAARFDATLLVEKHLAGASYRLLYLDGKLIDAVRRDPPVIKGDGKHSIRQLVVRENQRRRDRRPFTALSPLIIDKDCRNKLAQLGLSTGSLLAAGQTIQVKQAVNENTASENHNVRDLVHPQIVELGGKLARDLGVRFAGIDLMCSDISVPMSQSGGAFNEINTTPGIHHHYLVAEPEKAVPVAELVLDYLFSHRRGVIVL